MDSNKNNWTIAFLDVILALVIIFMFWGYTRDPTFLQETVKKLEEELKKEKEKNEILVAENESLKIKNEELKEEIDRLKKNVKIITKESNIFFNSSQWEMKNLDAYKELDVIYNDLETS